MHRYSSSDFLILVLLPSVIKFTGYFAERAEELSVKVGIRKTNSILTAVVGALVGQPEGVRLASLSAMNHMLPFAKNNFSVEVERNFIIQRLHDCALPAIQVLGADGSNTAFPNSPAIRECALECCTRIVELYYEKLDQSYVGPIHHITNTALDLKTNTPYEVMLQAINFWITLAQVEAYFEDVVSEGGPSVSQKLVVAAAGTLPQQLLDCVYGKGRDDDLDTAAAECLYNFLCAPDESPKRQCNEVNFARPRRPVCISEFLEVQEHTPFHSANMRTTPYPGARVTLANLPKEQSHLNDLCATVLSIKSAKSSSGAKKVPLLIPPFIIFLVPATMRGQSRLIVGQLLVNLDLDGKRVSIPEHMCNKIFDKLLVVDNKPIDIFIAPRDPMHGGPLT